MNGSGMHSDDTVPLPEPGDEVGLLLVAEVLAEVGGAVEHEHLVAHQVVEVELFGIIRLINVHAGIPAEMEKPVVGGGEGGMDIPGGLAVNQDVLQLAPMRRGGGHGGGKKSEK